MNQLDVLCEVMKESKWHLYSTLWGLWGRHCKKGKCFRVA